MFLWIADKIVYGIFNFSEDDRLSVMLHFFIYDTIKILVLIFLVAVENGLARIKAVRENGTDHYEKEAFLKKVDAIFRSFKGPEIRFIDAEGLLLEVHREVAQTIEKLIDKRRT